MDDDEGAIKAKSSSLTGNILKYQCVRPFQLNAMALMQSSFLKFTGQLERSAADSSLQSDVVSDFNTARRCLTGSITLQCGLSADKHKFERCPGLPSTA